MAWLLILLLAAGWLAAYLVFKRFTAREVKVNADAIKANGSADDLRAGFHQRRSWARFWPWLVLVLVGSLPCVGSWPAYVSSFTGLGILLAGYFARWFTPLLNLAMGLDYKPENYASPNSASWPDALIWKAVRSQYGPHYTDAKLQPVANAKMRKLLVGVWRVCLVVAGLLFLLVCYLVSR
jgi:hypothetical protein